MKRGVIFFVAVLAVGSTVVAWTGMPILTTVAPPSVALNGADQKVVELVEKARDDVSRGSRSAPAWGKLAMVLAAHGFSDESAVCYTQAERFDGRDLRWPYLHGIELRAQDPPAAKILISRALKLATSPADQIVILFRLTCVLIENGDIDQAKQQLLKLARLAPEDSRVQFASGLIAVACDDRSAALDHLGTLTENPCARQQACALLANLANADPTLAREFQKRASRLPMDLPWPDPIEAEMRNLKVNRLSRIEPFYEMQAQGRTAEALDFLRRRVAEAPDDETRLILGIELFKASELDEAVEALGNAIRFNKGNVKAHLFLGSALYQRGEKSLKNPTGRAAGLSLCRQAVAALDDALALQNDLAYGHLTRGRALMRLGRTDEAITALRKAVLCQPESAEMHLQLGEVLAESGRLKEGLENIKNAVQLARPGESEPNRVYQFWRAKGQQE